MKQGKRRQLVDYYERLEAAKVIYDCESRDEEVENIIKSYNISYVFWTNRITDEIPQARICSLENRKDIFKKVFANTVATIYEVIFKAKEPK